MPLGINLNGNEAPLNSVRNLFLFSAFCIFIVLQPQTHRVTNTVSIGVYKQCLNKNGKHAKQHDKHKCDMIHLLNRQDNCFKILISCCKTIPYQSLLIGLDLHRFGSSTISIFIVIIYLLITIIFQRFRLYYLTI